MRRKLLNWGILSTARINRALLPPLRASKRSRLLAVASRSAALVGEYAREREIPRAYGSYEALLADPEIDVIYNPLPNHLHTEWTLKALQAGKHVLCEKPMAITLEEMDRIQAAVKESGKVVTEAFMYRHHPQTLKVKELVDSGAIGRLQYVRGSYSYTLTREDNYRADPEQGGGSIWDVGCYPISYARLLAGSEPLEVFGRNVMAAEGYEECFYGEMIFANEVHAQVDSGFASPLRVQIEAVGTEGWLRVSNPYKPGRGDKILLTRGDETEAIRVPGKELYIGEVEDIEDAVLEGAAPRIPLQDSRGNLRAILALLESARSGGPQRL
jgi:predicted dehydrogenase